MNIEQRIKMRLGEHVVQIEAMAMQIEDLTAKLAEAKKKPTPTHSTEEPWPDAT
jgi:hypothetical protein